MLSASRTSSTTTRLRSGGASVVCKSSRRHHRHHRRRRHHRAVRKRITAEAPGRTHAADTLTCCRAPLQHLRRPRLMAARDPRRPRLMAARAPRAQRRPRLMAAKVMAGTPITSLRQLSRSSRASPPPHRMGSLQLPRQADLASRKRRRLGPASPRRPPWSRLVVASALVEVRSCPSAKLRGGV